MPILNYNEIISHLSELDKIKTVTTASASKDMTKLDYTHTLLVRMIQVWKTVCKFLIKLNT